MLLQHVFFQYDVDLYRHWMSNQLQFRLFTGMPKPVRLRRRRLGLWKLLVDTTSTR